MLAPWIAPYGQHTQVGPVFGRPSWKHPLGLDDGGIDMVTLLMWGARISLVVGFAATAVSMVIGGTVGVLAGYFGGRTDTILMRITDYFLVDPGRAADDRRRGDLGAEPLPHRDRDRDPAVDGHRARACARR